jgi:hypothetical protein
MSSRSNSSAAALRLFQQQEQEHAKPLTEDEEDGPAFLPSSPQTSRPATANRTPTAPSHNESPNPASDSFSDLSDASISKSALEEALEEHLRQGSVAASQMQAGVRSIWKGKFTG